MKTLIRLVCFVGCLCATLNSKASLPKAENLDTNWQARPHLLSREIKTIVELTPSLLEDCSLYFTEAPERDSGYMDCGFELSGVVSEISQHGYLVNDPSIREYYFDPYAVEPSLADSSWIDGFSFDDLLTYHSREDLEVSFPILRISIQFEADSVWFTIAKYFNDEFLPIEAHDLEVARTVFEHKLSELNYQVPLIFRVDPPSLFNFNN